MAFHVYLFFLLYCLAWLWHLYWLHHHPPKLLNTRARRALYDNLGKNEQLALTLDDAIQQTKNDGWRGNRIKEREVRYAILAILKDEAQTNKILEIVKNQDEY